MSDDDCVENDPESTGTEGRVPKIELETNGGSATLREVLEALADPRRRLVLYYLRDEGTATVDELARQIAAREADAPPEDVPEDRRKRLATELTHTHLPALADSLIVEYDRRSSTVSYSHPPGLLEEVLGLLARLDREHGS